MLILQGMDFERGGGRTLMAFWENVIKATCCWRFKGEATGNQRRLNCHSDKNKTERKGHDLRMRGFRLAFGEMCA